MKSRLGKIRVVLEVITFYLAFLGLINFSTTSTQTPTSQQSTNNLPIGLALSVSLETSEGNESKFAAEIKIDETSYMFLKTSGLAQFFSEVDYEDFSLIFSDFDGVWWGFDPWDEATTEFFGDDLTNSLRDLVENITSTSKSELKSQSISSEEEGTTLTLSLDFDTTDFSLPHEYRELDELFANK